MSKKLNNLFQNSPKISINDASKIVIMSDCHRGSGDSFDNFLKNQNIYKSALIYYYSKGYTYIELGDGDEMWEVNDYKDIIDVHIEIYKLLKKFHDSNRLIMIYGNHDISKKSPLILEKYFYKYYNKLTKTEELLLNNLTVKESLILEYKGNDIFLLHGHQADFLNSTLLKLSRFLVRNVWKNLENIGLNDPTSAAKNYQVTKKTEKKLQKWSLKNNKIIIAGHTHRATFPIIGQSLYFNDGSCIHPNGITAIEIENGKITLVKWNFTVNKDKILTASRNILAGEEIITSFFTSHKSR